MGYSDFTLGMLHRNFGIVLRDQLLFDAIGDLVPSPWLRESLRFGEETCILTEKARSEFIVAPILVECRVLTQRHINIFSGVTLDVEPQQGLTGECDFLLARSQSKYEMQWPIMLIVEAKKHVIDQGIAQCAAQMLGACRYNERDGRRLPYLYGCVTTGELWQFMKLEGQELQLHPQRFAINELSKILWVLVECLKDVDQQVSHAA